MEASVLSLVNGSEARAYDMHLESIALSHYAFRASGSSGANETADWIMSKFNDFGLQAWKEPFQFTNWDLLSKPTLIIDDDGNPSTTEDQTPIESFQCEHYSWPVNGFADLVILPLSAAADRSQVGVTPIGTSWDAIDTKGKIVLAGREVRFDNGWQETFKNKLQAQPPAAVIFTWWYDWMSFIPDFFSSAGGKPVTPFGHYFWDFKIASGFVNYNDGLFIRNMESSLDVSAKVIVNSVIGVGSHYNVVGKLTGYEHPDKIVIVMGHYDSIMSSAFCDNGAGTSGVIELARVFGEATRRGLYYPQYTILFIALAGEEIGLVGSIQYVSEHRAEMENITAVINLDCIGNEDFQITQADPDNGIDLTQIAYQASTDLGVSTQLIPEDQSSDEASFIFPADDDNILRYWWDTGLGLNDVHPVKSSILLISSPLVYYEGGAKPGWIHTSYDNSTSTTTLGWTTTQKLEDHIRVAALTILRVTPPFASDSDIDKDGIVSILDIAIVAKAYGANPGDPNWNPIADLNKDGVIDIVDIALVARDYGKTV
jgi:hypothetical protein